ncbi:ribonuclease E activity regulator RraA, partial [Ralstonia pseudosolanacearum]
MTTMMIPVTDLCDAHEDQLASGAVRVLAPVFHSFGARAAFAGPAATLKVFEDNG